MKTSRLQCFAGIKAKYEGISRRFPRSLRAAERQSVIGLDSPMDVPSRIDFCRADEARSWTETANVKRPWRADFFAAVVAELRRLGTPCPSVLELGSGPGFVAEVVIRDVPGVRYTLLDSSPAMHDLARARLGVAGEANFLIADFKRSDWADKLGIFDAVVTVQAVHELRHKRRAVGLHRAVRTVLKPGGVYLVCDHVAGPEGMTNTELYMTANEQCDALHAAGFHEISAILEKKGLVLHRALQAA